jgi:DNA-binding MarR family transcriptional regulator
MLVRDFIKVPLWQRVLVILYESPSKLITIAKKGKLTYSHCVHICQSLARYGLITAGVNLEDARHHIIQLTELGVEFAKALLPICNLVQPIEVMDY